jgi:hypothetical protein
MTLPRTIDVRFTNYAPPVDQFSTRDIEVITSSLRLYHGDMRDHGNLRACEHIATLIWRLNKPDRQWKAEAPS